MLKKINPIFFLIKILFSACSDDLITKSKKISNENFRFIELSQIFSLYCEKMNNYLKKQQNNNNTLIANPNSLRTLIKYFTKNNKIQTLLQYISEFKEESINFFI